MLPVSRKKYHCQFETNQFTIMCKQATWHSKLFQEAKSDREHCFSNQARGFLKHPLEQHGFTRHSMKFHTLGHVYFKHFDHVEFDGMEYTSGCYPNSLCCMYVLRPPE